MTFEVYETDRDVDRGDVKPNDGGCWICHRKKPVDELKFSMEWDAFVHSGCLKEQGVESITEFEHQCGTLKDGHLSKPEGDASE